MATINFELIGDRTAEDLYKDTAVTNDYKETIEVEYKEQSVVPEGATDIKEFTQEDNTILYSYKLEEVNPETDIEFGKKIVEKTFWLQDSELAWKATTARAKTLYDI